MFLSEISSSHICSLETFHLRCVSDVGVTRLLRTCQTRFQCFQTPCAKLRLHHTSQDRYVQLPQLSWPSCCQATAAVGQLASPNTAIFQRTSNPEVKAKAANHKTMLGLHLDVRHHDPTLCYQEAPSAGPRVPEGGAPVGESPADTRQLSAFCQTLLAAWLARRRPSELAGE